MCGTNIEINFMSWLPRMEYETSVLTALSLYSVLFQRIFYHFHLNIPLFLLLYLPEREHKTQRNPSFSIVPP